MATVANAASDIGPNDRKLLELEIELAKRWEAFNVAECDDLENKAHDIINQIRNMPADSIVGIAVKVREDIDCFDGEPALEALAADIFRLARRATS